VELTAEERKGLEEQVALDKAQEERTWNRIDAAMREAAALRAHIEQNEAKLAG
jgi:hypothetical protein